MSRLRTQRELLRYAITAVIVCALAITLMVNFKRLPVVGSGATTYNATFSDASGLVVGEEVRVAGIPVGRVTKIALSRGLVRVTFETSGVAVGQDSTARIEVKTLLGQHYMSLLPAGTPAQEGFTLPLEQTSTPVNLAPAFNQLTEVTGRIDPVQLAGAFDSVTQVLERTAPELGPALKGLTRLSTTISGRDAELRSLLKNTSNVSGVVAYRDQELADLIDQAGKILQVVQTRRDAVVQIIDGTVTLSKQLAGLLAENTPHLSSAIDNLNSVLKVLRASKDQLDQVLALTPLYAREFTNVGGTGHWFDSTIKFPAGMALCNQGGNGALDQLLNGILTPLNQAVNQSSKPCLPLGPASGGSR